MLVAPFVKAMEDSGIALPSQVVQHTNQPIPAYNPTNDIRLAEGQGIVHFKVHNDHLLEVIGTYRLERFYVERGSVFWEFTSAEGSISEGISSPVKLNQNLSAVIVFPVILLKSKHGLRTTFRFCTDADYRVMSISKFRELTGEVR